MRRVPDVWTQQIHVYSGWHAYDKTDYFKPTEPNAAGSARPHTGRHGISDLSREDLTEA